MNITNEELNELPKIGKYSSNNGGALYLKDNEIIKIQDLSSPHDHRESVINELLQKTPIANSSYPNEKVYIDGTYDGYTMPNFDGTTELGRAINQNEPAFNNRFEIITNLTNIFKEFHHSYFIK